MRILLSSLLFTLVFATPVLAQQDYHRPIPVDKYLYQCAAHVADTLNDDPGYKSPQGYLGLFQFSVADAFDAGLCSNPVPMMRTEQIWRMCDFKGPLAVKYDIRNEYDLRYDGRAKAVQFLMIDALIKKYDAYIYQKKYDIYFGKFINGITVTPDIIRGLLLTKGRAAVDEFFHARKIRDNKNQGNYAMATCLDQCMASKNTTWLCR